MRCLDVNNSKTNSRNHLKRPALEIYTPVDAFPISYFQNPTEIGEDITKAVSREDE
jgi:hypothetical protein